MSDLVGLLIGLILTLFIYSYVVGDNPLYRLAVHILVGVSAAYTAVVVIQQIIVPIAEQIRQNPTDRTSLMWGAPIFLALLLLLKRLPSLAWLGNNTVAMLLGVGAATALLGAFTGTLWPQITAVPGFNVSPLQGLLIAILTIMTLLSFQFSGQIKNGEWQLSSWQQGVTQIGRAVLMITFGALFAALLNTSLILLGSRLSYYLNQFLQQLS